MRAEKGSIVNDVLIAIIPKIYVIRGRRDVLYSESFLFKFGCHLTPGEIGRRARLERTECEDGLAAGGMNGDP